MKVWEWRELTVRERLSTWSFWSCALALFVFTSREGMFINRTKSQGLGFLSLAGCGQSWRLSGSTEGLHAKRKLRKWVLEREEKVHARAGKQAVGTDVRARRAFDSVGVFVITGGCDRSPACGVEFASMRG